MTSTSTEYHLDDYRKLTIKQLLRFVPKVEKQYVCDLMIERYNCHCLRLPPYHCEYNPIEKVWARGKGEVARANVTFNLGEAKRILEETIITKCGVEYWRKLEAHCLELETKALNADGLLTLLRMRRTENEHTQNSFVIEISDSSSDDYSDESD